MKRLSIVLINRDYFTGTIEAVSWFGNLGAVLPEYKATYKDGKWNLKTIGMGIS